MSAAPRRVALLMALSMSAPAVAGGTFDTWGVDAKSKAMGGAMVSVPGGAASTHYNPAALHWTDEAQLGVSFQLSVPQLSLETVRPLADDDPLSPALPPAYGGWTVGLVFPFQGVLEDWVTFGFLVYFPAQVLVHLRGHDPARPFFYMYDTYTDHYEASLGVSVSPFSWIALGGGLRYSAGQRGIVRLTVDPLRQRITEQSIDAWQYSIAAPTLGAALGPLGFRFFSVSAGVSYWDVLVTPMGLPAVIAFEGLDARIFAPLDSVTNFTPRTFSAGASVQSDLGGIDPRLALVGRFQVAVDVSYQMWSEAPPPFLGVSTLATGEDLEQLGLGDALTTPGEGQERVRSPGFVDTARVRVGAEWAFLKERVALRAGYGFRPSPVPDQTSGTNIVDTAVHALSGGVGLRFGIPPLIDGTIQVDGSFQTHILVPRTVVKEAPDDPVGGWTASGFLHEGALMVTYAF